MTQEKTTITLDDGRVFPVYEGKCLSWDLGSYHTHIEQIQGFPRMRAQIRAMKEQRPEQLGREYRHLLRASFDSIFGHAATQALQVLESEGVKAPASIFDYAKTK